MAIISAVIVAAGKGERLAKGGTEKQLLEIGGKKILRHTLEQFEEHSAIKEIILVVPSGKEKIYCSMFMGKSLPKLVVCIPGGKMRMDSVFNGLKACACEYVAIHDGVRPFVSRKLISRLAKAVIDSQAVIPAIPLRDTLKQIDEDGNVSQTLDRSHYRLVQTPQMFNRELLIKAYQRGYEQELSVTDDAALVENYGHPVKVISGDEKNIKITYKEDLAFAEYLLSLKN